MQKVVLGTWYETDFRCLCTQAKLHGSPVKWATLCSLIKRGLWLEKKLIQGHIEVRFEPRFPVFQDSFLYSMPSQNMKSLHAHPPPPKLLWLCFCCVGMHRNAHSLLVSLYPYYFFFVPLQFSCLIEQRFLLLWDSFLEEFLKVPAYWESSVRTSVEVSGKLVSTLSTTGLPFL